MILTVVVGFAVQNVWAAGLGVVLFLMAVATGVTFLIKAR